MNSPAASAPPYSLSMAAYHRAFALELEQMTRELPICAGDRVLDVGCGDGYYARWLASLATPEGEIVGVDMSEANLTSAKARHASLPHVRFVTGDIQQLPFENEHFDVVWCAQNLFSFPNPENAVRELARVVRPGGVVAILENDSLHQILLSWPIDVELAIAEAEFQSFQDKGHPEKFYIARGLRHLLRSAGLKPQRKRLYPSQRETPFNMDERAYLQMYLENLRQRITPYLRREQRDRVLERLDPHSPSYVLKEEDLTLTCLDQVAWGKKPSHAG